MMRAPAGPGEIATGEGSMLGALRKASGSWAMKIVLGLLALTFVVFFGGGYEQMGLRSPQTAVEVGDETIGIHEISRQFNEQVRRAAPLFGGRLDIGQAIEMGVLDRTIDMVIARALVDVAARDLGLVVTNGQAAAAIRSLPQFQDPATGAFDRRRFEVWLRQAGQSEGEFVAGLRADVTRAQYLGSVREATGAPRMLVETLGRWQGERRIADFVAIEADKLPDPGAPDTATLESWFAANKARFRAPEYRAMSLLTVRPEDLAAEVRIGNDEIAAEYERRKADFTRPERRTVESALFVSEDSARQALAAALQGQAFAEAMKAAGARPQALGAVTRREIPVAEIANAAFGLEAGKTSEPVKSPLGWHLVHVAAVEPGSTMPLDAASESVRNALALERARRDIYDVLNAVEDGLAGGSSLDDVARQVGVPLRQLPAVSRDGLDAESRPVEGLARDSQPLSAAFALAAGNTGDPVETAEGGFFLVRTDSVTAAAERPLDAVHDEAIAAWKAERRQTMAEELARTVADGAGKPGGLAAAAATAGLAMATTTPFDRKGDGAPLPGELVPPLFEAAVGEAVTTFTHAGAAVGVVREIVPAKDEDGFKDLAADLTDEIAGDIEEQLARALELRFPVDVDRAAVRDMLAPR